LFGRPLFRNTHEICQYSLRPRELFLDSEVTTLGFSKVGVSFMRGVLELEPSKRLTAEVGLEHDWVTSEPVGLFMSKELRLYVEGQQRTGLEFGEDEIEPTGDENEILGGVKRGQSDRLGREIMEPKVENPKGKHTKQTNRTRGLGVARLDIPVNTK
jgi:hypothetical protein